MSSGQQSEMKLLLAGAWPPLRPLPVFKYESPEYRASIEFDKARGEWLCRKTFLPSNKMEELRGGLAELAKALPPAHAEAFGECPATAHQGQEFAREAGRRLQSILEWKANFPNGALYSDLQRYLSESQQQEVEEILRLTLTARQLQFSPKNIACVFDALSKAGGRLATLVEISKRKSTLPVAESAVVEATTSDVVPDAPLSNLILATMEESQQEEVESALLAQEQPASAELSAQSVPEGTVSVPPGNVDADLPSFFEENPEIAIPQASVAAPRPQVRTRRLDAAMNRAGNSLFHQRVLEISGVQILAFAIIFLFAVISLPIGLTVGRGPLGQWLRDAEQSLFAAHVAPPAPTEHPVQTTSKNSAPPPPVPLVDSDQSSATTMPGSATLPEEKPRELAGDSKSSIEAPPSISNSPLAPESRHPAHSDATSGRDGSDGIIARVTPPPAVLKPAYPHEAVIPSSRARKSHASNKFAPSTSAPSRRSAPFGILVTTPAHGSKPFRVNFPEKPIAASSSFAMASELSVLVPPDPGSSGTHPSSRLRAGELVYFVWPRYSRTGERYGLGETVRVRATVGQLGQVLDVKLLSGSAALFPAARNAVHLWRYRPTLLNNRPIAVQQDITIEFRPPQYLSKVRTQHPS